MLKSLFILAIYSVEMDLRYFDHLKNLDDFEFFHIYLVAVNKLLNS